MNKGDGDFEVQFKSAKHLFKDVSLEKILSQ